MTMAPTLINDNRQTFRLTVGMSTFSSVGLDEQFVREIAKRTNIVRYLREYMESAKKHNIMVELTIDVRAVNGNGYKVEPDLVSPRSIVNNCDDIVLEGSEND